jgi:hypothetical protein
MMSFTYRLQQAEGKSLAHCIENGTEAFGETDAAAVAALRAALEEKMGRSEAVAPPTQPESPRVELREAAREEPSPQGPGEAPPTSAAG